MAFSRMVFSKLSRKIVGMILPWSTPVPNIGHDKIAIQTHADRQKNLKSFAPSAFSALVRVPFFEIATLRRPWYRYPQGLTPVGCP